MSKTAPGKNRCCFLEGVNWETFAEGAVHAALNLQNLGGPRDRDGQAGHSQENLKNLKSHCQS